MTGGAAAATCEPISWLRLERYQLGELPPAAHAAIADHLATCPRCRACLDAIRSPQQPALRPLEIVAGTAAPGTSDVSAPTRAPGAADVSAETRADRTAIAPAAARAPAGARGPNRPRWVSGWRGFALAGAGAAAAALLVLVLVVQRTDDAPVVTGHRIHTKGGDVAVELVRERGGSIAHEPTSFAPSDRFKVLLTCAPPLRLHADLMIAQSDGRSFPGPPSAIACGNRVPLLPAFRITGPGPATVCVAVDPAQPPPRERLRAAPPADTGAQMACLQLDRVED